MHAQTLLYGCKDGVHREVEKRRIRVVGTAIGGGCSGTAQDNFSRRIGTIAGGIGRAKQSHGGSAEGNG